MAIIGFLKSIILYQISINQNLVKVNELLESIEKEEYNNTFYKNGIEFFESLLQNVSYERISLTQMELELKKYKNINSTIESYFFTRPLYFLEKDIQLFYTLSNAFQTLITNIIYDISIEYKSITVPNLNKTRELQIQYRKYIIQTFWTKFYQNLGNSSSLSPSIGQQQQQTSEETYNFPKRVLIKWEVDILYNRPRMSHFGYIYDNFHNELCSSYNSKMGKGYLYFITTIKNLPLVKQLHYDYNIIVREYSERNDFTLQKRNDSFLVHYDLNGLDSFENVKRIYVYGYTISNRKKNFVGFAFYNNDHFQQSFQKFFKYTRE